jgi:hypothetical protein
MRTTIDIPEPLLAKARALALAEHTSLSAWVVTAMRHHLEADATISAPTALPVWHSEAPAPSWAQLKAQLADDDAAPWRPALGRVAEPSTGYDPHGEHRDSGHRE